MAGFLQELIDAPEPEQPNQSEQHLEMVNPQPASVPDWLETTRFLTDVTTAAGLLEHGRRDKGLARRIGDFVYKYRMLAAAPAAPEVVRDAERFIAIINGAIEIGSRKVVDALIAYEDAVARKDRTIDGYRAVIDAAIAAEKDGA